MARHDQLTGRKPMTSNSRSHSRVATKRRQHLNLQKVTIGGKKMKVSVKTLKTLTKQGKVG